MLARSQNFRWSDFRFVTFVLWAVFVACVDRARPKYPAARRQCGIVVVVISNKSDPGRQVSVDFAHKDAEAMRNMYRGTMRRPYGRPMGRWDRERVRLFGVNATM
jgi:hypothetical protein